MSIFNSLGSNYNQHFIIHSFGFGRKRDTARLKQLLHERYRAETIQLTYKGREAITLALKQLDLPEGSLVAVNGFTCYAVYQGITAAGLKPYYLDIELGSLNFSPEILEQALKNVKNIKAVIVQNTLGMPCNISSINSLCKQHNVTLVEDLAHSIGLDYKNGRQAGTVGQASALSFSQDKMIDAVSGGAVILQNSTEESPKAWSKINVRQRLACRLYPFETWFIRSTYKIGLGKLKLHFLKKLKLMPRPMSGAADTPHLLPSWFSRLAVLAFSNLESNIEHRQKIAEIYRKNLPKEILLRHVEGSLYLRFPILIEDRRALINFLKKSRIYVGDIWYDAPIGPKKYLSRTDYKNNQCPNSEFVAERILNLPTHININEEQAAKIAAKVDEWLKLER